MTIGQQVNQLWRVDAELHKWRRQGNNFFGTIMNVENEILQHYAGRPWHIDAKSMYKHEVDRGSFIVVFTHGYKFRLPKDQEIKDT